MFKQKILKVGVPVMGKGATNHIHRPEVIDAFLERGAELHFFVRPDYFDILQKHPSCHYIACEIPSVSGRCKTAAGFFEYWRNLYPVSGTRSQLMPPRIRAAGFDVTI